MYFLQYDTCLENYMYIQIKIIIAAERASHFVKKFQEIKLKKIKKNVFLSVCSCLYTSATDQPTEGRQLLNLLKRTEV